ncbi:MAG: hypothetical protein BWZ04_03023 [Firmicutes bacterium ADurb.BinA205]|nr:MAG: hypothetical protein BWZ04_03023 [Firmicutes bacterium ADurb.BinA205]
MLRWSYVNLKTRWELHKIVEKAPFTVVGIKKKFSTGMSYEEISGFWSEWMADLCQQKAVQKVGYRQQFRRCYLIQRQVTGNLRLGW